MKSVEPEEAIMQTLHLYKAHYGLYGSRQFKAKARKVSLTLPLDIAAAIPYGMGMKLDPRQVESDCKTLRSQWNGQCNESIFSSKLST